MRKACFLILAVLLSLAAAQSESEASECYSYWSNAGSGCDYAQANCSSTCSWAGDGGYVSWDVVGGTVTCDCQC